jgi:hypothetical protein
MRLASVTFREPTRRPDSHDVSAQASASKHFTSDQFNLELADGLVTITHPSGLYPANIVSAMNMVGAAPLVEKVETKDSAKSEAAKKAWETRRGEKVPA